MSTTAQTKALKVFVGSLFLVLLGGSILLFLIASDKLGDANPLHASNLSAQPATCLKDKVMTITGYGDPVSAELSGDTVRLLLKKEEHYTLATINGCTGETLGLLKILTREGDKK